MKGKKFIIIIPLLIAILVFIGVYFYYYREDSNSLNITDRNWLENNIDSLVDIELPSDYPVYGDKDGVFASFINGYETAGKIEFNKISYSKEKEATTSGYRFRVLSNDTELTDKDLLIGEDVYVIVSKEAKRIDDLSSLAKTRIGVLDVDISEVSYYMSNVNSLVYKKYTDSESLFKGLDNKEVDSIIIPNIMYLNKTLVGDYKVNYTVSEMSKKIVLTLSDKNSKFNTITKK